MNDNELINTVKEYIANIEIINRKQSNIDLFSSEDKLNRELSIDLFVVSLSDKINYILNESRVSGLLVNS